MTSPSFSLPPPDDTLESLVNEVIDAEAEGDDARALELIRKGAAQHPGFGARLAATRAAVKSLRQPVFVPDQRVEVLTEVDYLRPFLSPRVRKQISATRVAIAAGIVMTASLLMTLQYMYPQVTPQGAQPGAVSGVVEASRADAVASVRSLASMVDEIKGQITAPVGNVIGRPRGVVYDPSEPLRLGKSSAYEADLSVKLPHKLEQPGWILADSQTRIAAAEKTGFMERLMAQQAADKANRARVTIIGGSDRASGAPLLLYEQPRRSTSVRSRPLLEQLEVNADGIVLFGPDAAKQDEAKDDAEGER
ncbi:MAG TPA: hypothetical protein VD997_00510 [Phycisphaerales bacterium]|nr:hypothetical protein [Phycisphaerales bacterium]